MKRLVVLTLSLGALVACGGGNANVEPGTVPGAENAPAREPLKAEELRARWEKIAGDEAEVVHTIDDLAGLPPNVKAQKLAHAREGAGFVASALANAPPPSELATCHAMGLEGAKGLKSALDGIDALWAGRATGDRRAESQRLAEELCIAAGKLAAGRSACGVTAKVPSPVLCAAQ